MTTISQFTDECKTLTCSYFDHYLAYGKPGEPNIEHDVFHAAERRCTQVQLQLSDWMDRNPDIDPLAHPVGRRLWAEAEKWERKVRA